jgi:hypothetical protein
MIRLINKVTRTPRLTFHKAQMCDRRSVRVFVSQLVDSSPPSEEKLLGDTLLLHCSLETVMLRLIFRALPRITCSIMARSPTGLNHLSSA